MIRRLFWLILGAVGGIAGYRRVERLSRRVRGRSLVTAARETVRFTRDVRDGMDEYMARHPRDGRSTLGKDTDEPERQRDGVG